MQHSGYASAVNRRLASAKFYLSLSDVGDVAPIGWQKTACYEAAAGQLYLALHHYLNELLGHYRQQPLTQPLADVFTGDSSLLADIPAFFEIQQLLQHTPVSWQSLLQLPQQLITVKAPPLPVDTAARAAQPDTLIAHTAEVDSADLWQAPVISRLIDQLERLILRQRAHFAEY
ncbi:MAG: hypothetical protein KTR20_02060 [Cellvibrionaceae bacterium]|nr:hypothetical protein [Cellvibrionaceae bacterium]